MTNPTFHDELLATFADVQTEFDRSLQDAKLQEEHFYKECHHFGQNVDTLLQQAFSNFADDTPLAQAIGDFYEHLNQTNLAWQERIAKKDTGVRFRQNFNDSLLVFVYGKVKSGKSSLGNYIAWGHTDPTPDLKSQAKTRPTYTSHAKTTFKHGDKDNEAITNQEFRVGATEATSSIQGFSLPGLTWIDSPGLHSVNDENGQLAKDYVAHSDLILYTMKSNEPGRLSDIKEIAELHHQDKTLLLLITGSDVYEEDVDDEGNLIGETVMKPIQTRQQQQQAVRDALNDIPALQGKSQNIKIISFSAQYAQKHPNDAQKFADSGMAELFEILKHTAKTDGIRLKQQTPLKNFKVFLQQFHDDLQKYHDYLDKFKQPIDDIVGSLPHQVNKKTIDIQRQMAQLINEELGNLHNQRNNSTAMNTALQALTAKISQAHIAKLTKAQQDIIQTLAHNLTVANQAISFDLPEFTIQHKTETVKKARQGTKNKSSVIGGAAGGFVGFFVGGFAGALVGASIGAGAGRALGDGSRLESHDIRVPVGDNLASLQQNLLHDVEKSIANHMTAFETQITEQLLAQTDSLITDIKGQVDVFENSLNSQLAIINNKLGS